jgi:TFIIF-interacting CTD phosphatase-like protein
VSKDLRLIGRELNRTIIIDNLSENFRLTPDNGIHISDFCGEFEDN